MPCRANPSPFVPNEKAGCISFYDINNFVVSIIINIFAPKIKDVTIMTTLQLRAKLFREMSPLLDSEAAMEKLIKYVKKLRAKKEDPTLMTEEEFFRRVDEAKKGPTYRMLPNEDLTTFLRRIGNDI